MIRIEKTLVAIFFMITLLGSSATALTLPQHTQLSNPTNIEDYDPNVDI